MHLRMPSYDRGVTSFLWAFGLGLFLWLGMLSIGVSGATAFILAFLAACAIFFYVRLYGEDEIRRARRLVDERADRSRVIAGECADKPPSELAAEDGLEPVAGARARFRGRARRTGTLLE